MTGERIRRAAKAQELRLSYTDALARLDGEDQLDELLQLMLDLMDAVFSTGIAGVLSRARESIDRSPAAALIRRRARERAAELLELRRSPTSDEP